MNNKQQLKALLENINIVIKENDKDVELFIQYKKFIERCIQQLDLYSCNEAFQGKDNSEEQKINEIYNAVNKKLKEKK